MRAARWWDAMKMGDRCQGFWFSESGKNGASGAGTEVIDELGVVVKAGQEPDEKASPWNVPWVSRARVSWV